MTSSRWGFLGPMKQTTEINLTGFNWSASCQLRFLKESQLARGRPVGLVQVQPRSWTRHYLEQIQLVVRPEPELGFSRFQIRRPNHSGARRFVLRDFLHRTTQQFAIFVDSGKQVVVSCLTCFEDTVFTRISAAALISFFAPQVRRLFEGGAYLNIAPDKFTFSIFL